MYWIDPKHWVDLLKLKWLHCYFVLVLDCPGVILNPLFHFWPLCLEEWNLELEISRKLEMGKLFQSYLTGQLLATGRWSYKSRLTDIFQHKNKTELTYYAYDSDSTVYCRAKNEGAYATIEIHTTSICYLEKAWPGDIASKEPLYLGTHSLQIESAIDELIWECETGAPLIGTGVTYDRAIQYADFAKAEQMPQHARSLMGVQSQSENPSRRSGKTTSSVSVIADLIKKGLIPEKYSGFLPSTCTVCHRPSTFHCSRCGKEKYCGPVCQKAAWPTHKQNCKK